MQTAKAFVTETVERISALFKEAGKAPEKSASIKMIRKDFSASMRNGGRNPQDLLNHASVLQREFRRIGLTGLFTKSAGLQNDILEFLRNRKGWEAFYEEDDPLNNFIS